MPRRVTDQVRRAELAAIHVAKKQLGLDDETYRTMLWTLARVRSAKDLDHAGRQAVIEHLRRRGFARVEKPAAPSAPAGAKPNVAPDRLPLLNKIEALLAEGGKPWNYARSMASRMFKLQLEWCQPDHLRRLVAALEVDKRRRGAKPA